MVTRMGWGGGWRVMAEHPWLTKILLGALVLLLVVIMVRRRTQEHAAQTAFREQCAARGLDEDRCDDLLDRHHVRCFALSYSPGTKTSPESFDHARYTDCVLISPKAWSAKRRQLLEEQRRRSREERGLDP